MNNKGITSTEIISAALITFCIIVIFGAFFVCGPIKREISEKGLKGIATEIWEGEQKDTTSTQ